MALTTRCSSHLSTLPGIDRASENGFSLLFNNQHQLDDGEKKYYVHGCGIILSGLAELRGLIPAAEGGRGATLQLPTAGSHCGTWLGLARYCRDQGPFSDIFYNLFMFSSPPNPVLQWRPFSPFSVYSSTNVDGRSGDGSSRLWLFGWDRPRTLVILL